MFRAVAFAMAIGLCGVTPSLAQKGDAKAPIDSALSKPNIRALNKRYPHWALATLAPPATAACAAASAAPASVLTGDFNGDGISDTVVQITTPSGPRVVVLVTRVELPQVVEVAAPAGLFIVHKHGSYYASPDLELGSYYANDTLGTDVCGAGEAWLWTGATFQKIRVKN
jgi:hypothetical protein